MPAAFSPAEACIWPVCRIPGVGRPSFRLFMAAYKGLCGKRAAANALDLLAKGIVTADLGKRMPRSLWHPQRI